jgi:acyl-CoA thioesterase
MKDFIEKVKNDPYAKFLGVSIDKIETGYVECSLILTENMMNFLGTPHGGLLYSLADVALSIAANNNYPPTFALDIMGTYFKPAKPGDKLVASAMEINTTKKTGHYRMEIKLNGELIATFSATVFRKA